MRKRLLLILFLAITCSLTAGAANFQYVGTRNTQVTSIKGIGSTAYYLLKGNLGVKDATIGTPGGFYDGVFARGTNASQECVCRFIAVTDSSYYVYFPSDSTYWKRPTAYGFASVTKNAALAAVVTIKSSSNIAGNFTITATDSNEKLYYFQDWGNMVGVMAPVDNKNFVDTDGETDWTIVRADVKEEISFPVTLTTADGLMEQPDATNRTFKSRDFYSYDPITSLRFTVTHTSPLDDYNTDSHRGYVFFSLAEMSLYDANGNKINLAASNFSSNATEESEGATANLCDGSLSNFFHTCWNSHTGTIGGEHYIEVTLPSPIYGFSFEMSARDNYKNFPASIGITRGGEGYDAFAQYSFAAGSEVAAGALEAGKSYTMKEGSTALYPAFEANGRARLIPSSDCMFTLENAGTGSFYIKYKLRGGYVTKPAAAGNLELTTDRTAAGVFAIDANGKISCNGYYLAITNEALAATTGAATWTFYSAAMGNSAALEQLKAAIDAAQWVLTNTSDQYENGEKAALQEELQRATALYEAGKALASEVLVEMGLLNKKAANFRANEVIYMCDSIDKILMAETFDNGEGNFPVTQSTLLSDASQAGRDWYDAATYTTVAQVDAYVTSMRAVVNSFWQSRIVVSKLPLTYTTANGLPGTLVKTGTRYKWVSPQLLFKEPVSTLRMTVTGNNTNNKAAGYYCFALAEFFLLNANGDTISLSVDNFSTNAQEPTEGPLQNICDKNIEWDNYFHTRWSSGGYATGNHYVQVSLPEPLTEFSFGYLTRNLENCPTVMTLTNGTDVVEVDSLGFKLGEKITKRSDLSTNGYYVLYGNYNKKGDTPTDGSGFYSGTAVTGYTATGANLLRLEDAGNGAYRIHYLLSDRYIAAPTGWKAVAATYKQSEAGSYLFTESTNLADAFNIYMDGTFDAGYPNNHYMLEDWGSESGMGAFPVTDFASADLDGEADWYLYRAIFTANEDSVKMLGLINHAVALSPIEGNNPGCYANLGAYKNALATATSLRYNGGSNADYVAATTALRSALDNMGSVIAPAAGKTYLIVSAFGAYLKQQGVEKAMSAEESNLGWNNLYSQGLDSAAYHWTLEASQDSAACYYIKNVATGSYIGFGATTSAVVTMSETPTNYCILPLGKAQFTLLSSDAIKAGCSAQFACLHTGGHSSGAGMGGSIVNWSSGIDSPTAWYLREVGTTLVELANQDMVPVTSTTYYTLNGQTVAAPSKGLYIIKKVYSDGNIKVEKILIQ